MNVVNTTSEQWTTAQQNEFLVWKNTPSYIDDDWNLWWKDHFENYQFLNQFEINSIIEIGCGPYAKNIQYITENMKVKPVRYGLNDPLLDNYIDINRPVADYMYKVNAMKYNMPLEILKPAERYDCVVCINVLSHVYDVTLCMENMYKMLNLNGILIFGEDLTTENDLLTAPEILTDKMHPIRFDAMFIKEHLKNYKPVFDRVLSKAQGRNPRAHYATVLFAGQK